MNAVLDFTAHSLEQLGVGTFTNSLKGKVDFQSFLSWIIEYQKTEYLSPITYIHLLSIIRKTINTPDLITDRTLIVDQVIDIAKEHALSFEIKLNRVQQLVRQSMSTDLPKHKKAVHFDI